MQGDQSVSCEIRYKLDMAKLLEFEAYARAWVRLIERHGGTHHDCFVPRPIPEGARISFPQIGSNGPEDVAVALFSFPDDGTYQRYRQTVAEDPDCGPAADLYKDTKCFISYERLFLKPVERLA